MGVYLIFPGFVNWKAAHRSLSSKIFRNEAPGALGDRAVRQSFIRVSIKSVLNIVYWIVRKLHGIERLVRSCHRYRKSILGHGNERCSQTLALFATVSRSWLPRRNIEGSCLLADLGFLAPHFPCLRPSPERRRGGGTTDQSSCSQIRDHRRIRALNPKHVLVGSVTITRKIVGTKGGVGVVCVHPPALE